jgi:hypothetical protein
MESLGDLKSLLLVLRQRQSAEKIKLSLEKAKEIGGSIKETNRSQSPSDQPVSVYLWDNTCCINKAVVGEHNESLATMDEWHRNVEFRILPRPRAIGSILDYHM